MGLKKQVSPKEMRRSFQDAMRGIGKRVRRRGRTEIDCGSSHGIVRDSVDRVVAEVRDENARRAAIRRRQNVIADRPCPIAVGQHVLDVLVERE
jgi:hypothetical protein